MAAPPEKLERLLAALSATGDRSERIQMLIDLADRFEEVPESVARRPFDDAHKAPHCESEAYVWAVPRDDGTLQFHFAVENPQGISARAMAVILDRTLSGEDPRRVLSVSTDLPFEIFGRELSMGKSMGLTGMLGMVLGAARRQLAAAPGAPSEAAPAQRK